MDGSGNIQARYTYDPWGRRTKVSGNWDADFGFAGHYYHAPSGLHLALYRAYSADLGRWLSRDPIGTARVMSASKRLPIVNPPNASLEAELLRNGPNVYVLVGDEPINRHDPLGLDNPGCDVVGDGTIGFTKDYFNKPCPLEAIS
ncbi:MAG: RHS repeat-associated core domain-containing protein [Verrucomicrobiia bacterium]